jgi:hypothetical protein
LFYLLKDPFPPITRAYLLPPLPKGYTVKNEIYFLVQLSFYRLKTVSRYPLSLHHPPSVPPQKDYLPEGLLRDITEDLPNFSAIIYIPLLFCQEKKTLFFKKKPVF